MVKGEEPELAGDQVQGLIDAGNGIRVLLGYAAATTAVPAVGEISCQISVSIFPLRQGLSRPSWSGTVVMGRKVSLWGKQRGNQPERVSPATWTRKGCSRIQTDYRPTAGVNSLTGGLVGVLIGAIAITSPSRKLTTPSPKSSLQPVAFKKSLSTSGDALTHPQKPT